jgi:hypothetical protein
VKTTHFAFLTGLIPRRAKKLFPHILIALSTTSAVFAANFTTTFVETGVQDWTMAIWQPGTVAPTPGNTYEVLNGGLVRNPVSVSASTFPGDALQLDSGSTLRAKPPTPGVTTTLGFPGVGGKAGLVLNGGAMNPGTASTTFVITGSVFVSADSLLLGPGTSSGGRNFSFPASISGTNNLIVQDFLDNNTGVSILSTSNLFSGNWIVNSGRLTGTGVGSLGTGSITVASGSLLELMYDIQSPGVLTLMGNSARMTLNRNCQFAGAIINGTALSTGAHPYSQLAGQFPGNFSAGGSGSILIVPPPSTITISATGNSLSVSFPTAPGHAYTLQTNDSLSDASSWTPVVSPISGDGSPKTVVITATGAQGFYRVLVE